MKIKNVKESEHLNKPFSGDFYDADYFERGQETGKGWLQNYKWMPRRTFKEALAIADYLDLNEKSRVLDVGCAKGFIVKALRHLEIKADGCDISKYALSFAPEGCWDCSSWESHYNDGYTHVIIKDMLEHLTLKQLDDLLLNVAKTAQFLFCVIPMGDNGMYRIPEYHMEISHVIAENEEWWINVFEKNNWKVKKRCAHINGLKDNWQSHSNGIGNHVFLLEKS